MGSGLGLAIVKMLVELLGGELKVESEIIIDSTDCLKGIHVLFVEDNEFNMEIAQIMENLLL